MLSCGATVHVLPACQLCMFPQPAMPSCVKAQAAIALGCSMLLQCQRLGPAGSREQHLSSYHDVPTVCIQACDCFEFVSSSKQLVNTMKVCSLWKNH